MKSPSQLSSLVVFIVFSVGICQGQQPAPRPVGLSDAMMQQWVLAEHGDVAAQVSLGSAYRTGQGAPKDKVEAVKWFGKAAEQGNADGQVNLGEMYAFGSGVLKDKAKAISLYRKAADQGSTKAQYDLGNLYENWDGEPIDEVEAVKWLGKAAEQGDSNAQVNLGTIYSEGKRIPQDKVMAAAWFRKAAEQGNGGAYCNLGLLYESGQGVVQDDKEACCCFLVAAALNIPSALEYANRVRGRLSSSDYAEAQRRAKQQMPNQDKVRGVPQLVGSGTGFVISEDGYLLTCNHVVQDSKAVTVLIGGTKYPATIVKRDAANDLALLKIVGNGFWGLSLQTDLPAKGTKVLTIGFPNPDLQGVESKYTDGTISSLSGLHDDIRTMQISVPVQTGNSGGALVDEHGNAVGIVVSKLNAVTALGYTGDLPQNVNYAVKIMYAMPLIQSIEGLQKRIRSPDKTAKPTNITAAVEKATCMVMVYK
jgi:S1-C subfamily serine protease